MNINIKATNIELDEPLKIWVNEKFIELKKLLDPFKNDDGKRALTQLFVEIGRTSKHHNKGDVYRAEAQIQLPKKLLRAESTNADLRTAIIETRDELSGQIIVYRGKRVTRARKWARFAKEKFLR
jgi:ribosomal subunit interface protein